MELNKIKVKKTKSDLDRLRLMYIIAKQKAKSFEEFLEINDKHIQDLEYFCELFLNKLNES